MRTREEIENYNEINGEMGWRARTSLILEILLDIRDLLQANQDEK